LGLGNLEYENFKIFFGVNINHFFVKRYNVW
jgi:hypothetical protein